MNIEDLTKEQVVHLLTETVHTMIMYPNHKTYIREIMLRDKTDLKPQELAARLSITLGEVLVIINELKKNNSVKKKK
jgi:hypothetical protein